MLHHVLLLGVTLLAMTTVSHADDFDVVRGRWREKVLQNAPTAEIVRGDVGSLKADGTWADVAYSDRTPGGWKPNRHLTRLVNMAKAYRTVGHPLHDDAALKNALLRAWDGWFSVLPPSKQNPFGTPESDNWWHNEFGAVTHLENFAILMGDDLDAPRFAKGVPTMRRAWTLDADARSARDQGDNLLVRTFLGMRLAALTRDEDLMRNAVARTVGELKFSSKEGLHRDYSFRTHDLFYSMHYGLGYILHPTDTLLAVSGTRWAPPLKSLQILSDYVLEGHQWLFRKGWMDYATTGRAIAETDYQARRQQRALDAYANLLAVGAPRRPELEAFMRRIEHDTGEGEPVGNRHFWRADFMAHKRPTFHASVRMASKRLKAAELINQQGLQGFYTADGVISLQRQGPEYSNLMPVWDWTRLPGVTCRAGTQPPNIAPPERWGSGGHIFGVGEFVGGVSDGTHGATVFDYERHQVKARKGWFFFDREVVCLGASIASPSEDTVRTSINQCHLKGDVTVNAAGATTKPTRGERALPEVSWVHHDQVGYIFPEQSNFVVLKNEAQTGNWKRVHGESSDKSVSTDVFSLWLDHGVKPQNAGYAYIIVPETSPAQIAEYARALPVRILANTPQLQAVAHEGDKVTEAIFYEPGALAVRKGLTLRVDQACALLLKESKGAVTVSVSNPKQEALQVWVEWGTSRVAFDLPGGEFAGQSLTRSFKAAAK